MTTRAFMDQAREVEALRSQFPDAPIRQTGIGFYAPQLTVEQWMRHYGAQDQARGPGVLTPEAC